MASPVVPDETVIPDSTVFPDLTVVSNPPVASNPPFLLQRSISVRPATTIDGFTVIANKHYTYHIERGTLEDAIRNSYIDSHDALMARTMKARRIAREIMENKRRKLDVPNETKENDVTIEPKAPETVDRAKSADVNEAANANKEISDEYSSIDEDSSDNADSENELIED